MNICLDVGISSSVNGRIIFYYYMLLRLWPAFHMLTLHVAVIKHIGSFETKIQSS